MLKRDILATFTSNAALVVIMIGTATITSRMLGPEGRGALALACWLPSIAATFALLGQDSVNSTFAGLYKQARPGLFLQTLVFTAFGSAVSVAVICAYFFWLPVPRGQFATLSSSIVWASCFIGPVIVFSTLIFSLVRGVGKVVLSSVLRIVAGLTSLVALAVFLVWMKQGVTAAVWIVALAPLPATLLAIVLLRDEIKPRPGAYPGWLPARSLKFGLPLCLATAATFLVYRLDQGILGYMVGVKELGLYAVAVSLAEQLKMLPGSISTAFLPRLANELETRRSQVPAVFRVTVVASLGAMLLASLAGAPAIVIMFGWAFVGAIPPFLVLLPGVAALGGASILASDLLTRQKPGYNLTVAWATLAVSVAGNLLLIPFLGIMGSALAATLSYMVALWLWILFYTRESSASVGQLRPGKADIRLAWSTGCEVLARFRRRPGANVHVVA